MERKEPYNAGRVLSVSDTAGRLGVSRRTVLRWVEAGHFPNAYRLNPAVTRSPWRIPARDLEVFQSGARSPWVRLT